MKTYLFCFLAIIQILLSANKAAHADEYWSFVEMHCIPSIGLFSIKEFSEYNLPGIGNLDIKDLEKIEKSDGVFLLSRYVDKISGGDRVQPFTCQIERGKTSHNVSIYVGANHKPQATGTCGAARWAALVVKIDDIEVARMGAGGGCNESEDARESVIVNFGMNTVEHCREYKGFYIKPSLDFQPIKEECKVTKLEQPK